MTTALKIEQLPADKSCQLNASQLKQVVGGLGALVLSEMSSQISQAIHPNTSFGQVHYALNGAADEAERRGDVNRANQLREIDLQRQIGLYLQQSQVTQVVAPA